ncbi:ribosomal protection-like ABC-F family protein [Limosilactobacillus oris]|uniref:ribosomal protection-like ABC-F family protein n=1 Tax=Limosilactobacillus oris TaxID=1632 RepID=UPI00388F7928
MQTITIRNLNFAYPGQPALFTDCNLDFNSNWRLGLVGRNGRGKTTLLQILQGRWDYRGRVTSKLNFAYFPLTIADPALLSGDALLTACPNPALEQWQVERELGLMGVDPALLWQPYQTLSGGERTKVQLAALFAQDDSFFLDEPTNHLDLPGRRQVAAYLARKQSGFIITSHDQDFLDQVIDHTLVIERHQLVLSQGNYSTYFHQKEQRDQHAQATNRQLRAEIKDLKATRQQRLQWAQRAEGEKKGNSHTDKGFIGAKAARMMKKTVSTANRLDQAITERQGLLENVEEVVPLTLNYQPAHQQTLLSLDQVSLALAGQQFFRPLTCTVHRQEQLALVGPNGVGKSSLIKAIAGRFMGELSGKISRPTGITVSYVRQDYATNTGSLRQFADRYSLPYDLLLSLLRKLGMDRATFTVPIEQMSMGQQKKVELARSLLTPAQLYVWDEPLNYLDTYNQQQLIQLVKEYRPPLLFVEHDQHFINAVASQQVPVTPL